jgi:hypothetical protein
LRYAATASSFNASADGTSLTVGVQISLFAVPGSRTVVVTAPTGSSSEIASPFNTVQVVDSLGGLQSYEHIPAPTVGVVKEQGVGPSPTTAALVDASAVGITVGPIVTRITPATIARGQTLVLQVEGESLDGLDAVVFTPSDGLSVEAPTVVTGGRLATVRITADSGAPFGPRRIDVFASGRLLRPASAVWPTLLVTPVAPVLDSIVPSSVAAGTTFTLQLRGRNFQNATAIKVTPADNVTIGPIAVDSGGTLAEALVTITPNAARGARLVTLVAPAGETSTQLGPNNQLNIGDSPVTVSDITAPIVGVSLGDASQPHAQVEAGVQAPHVGVLFGVPVAPGGTRDSALALAVGVEKAPPAAPGTPFSRDVVSADAGVVFGAAVVAIEPAVLVRGQSTQLVVRGNALPVGATLQFVPADSITSNGVAAVSADGTQLTQGVTVSTIAPVQAVGVRVLRPDGQLVDAASPAASSVWISAGAPEVISLEPILARQGEAVTLIVRGLRFADALRVAVEPATGVDISNTFTINAAGTEISVPIVINDLAPLGARVIRVFNRAGASTSVPAPANTFTVFPKE